MRIFFSFAFFVKFDLLIYFQEQHRPYIVSLKTSKTLMFPLHWEQRRDSHNAGSEQPLKGRHALTVPRTAHSKGRSAHCACCHAWLLERGCLQSAPSACCRVMHCFCMEVFAPSKWISNNLIKWASAFYALTLKYRYDQNCDRCFRWLSHLPQSMIIKSWV